MEDVMNWIQTNEPGTRYAVNTLSVTSDKTLYAVIGNESIYRLPIDEAAWQLVNADFPRQNTHSNGPIAEHDGTLYIISSYELFASTDSGETWNLIGSCPKGHVRDYSSQKMPFIFALATVSFVLMMPAIHGQT